MKWIALATTVWLLGGSAVAFAGVNCNQVNKYLQTGRSVQDVSETMVIPEEEVRKCQEEAADAEPGAAAANGEAADEAPKSE